MVTRILALALLLAAGLGQASDLLTEKQSLSLAPFATANGGRLAQVTVGYESHGRLNAARDNAVLITHYFSGNSHAAGKYRPEDAKPGYWDALIGPGKAIDTDKYFVLSVDTLANLSAYSPQVITTGPASLDPATGKPYGLSFPVLSVSDFVAVQKAVLDSLGIEKLHAIAGPSGGAIQAMQWAADQPGFASRYVAVIGPGLRLTPAAIAELDSWMQPILLDPAWRQGNYYADHGDPGAQPLPGLVHALRNITLAALANPWLESHYGRAPADPARPPGQSLLHRYRVTEALAERGLVHAPLVDANHLLYTARAYQQFDVADRITRMRGRFLFVAAQGDRIFPPSQSAQAAAALTAHGQPAQVITIDGGMGHLDGLEHIGQAGQAIKAFIEAP